MGSNDWRDDRKLVLHQLEQQGNDIERIESKIEVIHDDILTLKVKSSTWGAIAGGTIAAIITIIAAILQN